MSTDRNLEQENVYRIAQGKYNVSEIVEMCKKEVGKSGQIKIYEVFKNPLIRDEIGAAISILNGTGEYMLDKLPGDVWVIRKNPNHELGQSVIKTNQNQRFFSLWSLILAAASVIFIGISAYLQYRDQTEREIRELKEAIEQQSTQLKDMNISLKGLIPSIEKLKNDSIYVRLKK